jgi:uncharacterized protein YlzI (FlbEa/FlbD family)
MTQQNNMTMFVSLTPFKNGQPLPSDIEVNPNYIVSMSRVDGEYVVPHTELLLMTGDKISITQTPEEVDQAIVQTYNKTVENMTSSMQIMFENLDDFDID